ncbi:Predicted chitinase; lytic protein [Pseudomonas aeruginosa]|nr:Predicted chitinase; lytic protein [Pseudomonas aeruginosa]
MKITADQLDRATGCGAATATTWVEHINGAMARFEINTAERVAMFLAQVGHESQSLRRLVENLNYSAEGLLKTWPKRITPAEAKQYARQPERSRTASTQTGWAMGRRIRATGIDTGGAA